VASGNKKTARAEAAVACLQELAALPTDQTVPPHQPHGVPPLVVPGGAPRPPSCPVAQLPQSLKPVRPLMSLQPRPQFSSLHSYRPPNPSEQPPPDIDSSDFTSDVFDDFQKFQPTSATQHSADESHESSEAVTAEDQQQVLGFGQSEEKSGPFGLLGDAPQELEADCDDADYDGTSTVFNEFAADFLKQFMERRPIRNTPDIFGENPENIHPEIFDGPNTTFAGPCDRIFPEFGEFAEDTFTNRQSIIGEYCGILGVYSEGTSELCDDFCEPFEEFEHWEEDFQTDMCFRNPVGFVPRGMRHARPLMQQPFRARVPRSPLIAGPSLLPQRFPRYPSQRFPRPFNVRAPCPPAPLPRGVFRPRMRPFMKQFPRPH